MVPVLELPSPSFEDWLAMVCCAVQLQSLFVYAVIKNTNKPNSMIVLYCIVLGKKPYSTKIIRRRG